MDTENTNFHTSRATAALAKERNSCGGLNSLQEETIKAFDALLDVYQRDFMPFIKAYDAHLSEKDVQNFFMEREWRQFGALDFTPDQVTSVVVAPRFGERLRQNFPEYTDKVKEVCNELIGFNAS